MSMPVAGNVFDRDGVRKRRVRRSGKRAARLGLGNDVDRLKAITHGRFFFQNNGAVEVLAALGGQVQAVLLRRCVQFVKNDFGRVRGRVRADFLPQHFAGRAAHDQNIPLPQMRGLEQRVDDGAGLRTNGIQHQKTP